MTQQWLAVSSIGSGQRTISYSCLEADTFYIQVYYSSGSGTYTLSNQLVLPTLANDIELNDTYQMAQSIPDNVTQSGHLGYKSSHYGPPDEDDWYWFVNGSAGTVTVSATFNNGVSGWIALYNDNNFTSWITTSSVGSGFRSTGPNCLSADTFFVRIHLNSGCGEYDLNIVSEAGTIPSEAEPNDTPQDALSTVADMPNTGYLGNQLSGGSSDVIDWYTFVKEIPGDLIVTAEIDSNLTGFAAIYTKGNTSSPIAASNAGSNLTVVGTASCISSDTFYIAMHRTAGCGSYTLSLEDINKTIANDQEPNDLSAQADILPLVGVKAGHLGATNQSGGTDIDDWFSFNAPNGLLSIEAHFGATLYGYIALYDSTESFLTWSGTDSLDFVLSHTLPYTGKYLLRVHSNSGCAEYELNICGKDAFESNESASTAPDLPRTGINRNAAICPAGDQDYFAISVTSAKPHIRIRLSNLPADYQLLLLDANETLVAYSTTPGLVDEIIDFNNATPGQYYIGVYGNGDAHSATGYKLDVQYRDIPFGSVVKEEQSLEEEIVKQPARNRFKVYPNPATDEIHVNVDVNASQEVTTEIIDLLGNIVSSKNWKSEKGLNKFTINLDNIKSGVYTLRVKNGKEHFTKKITIKN